MKWAFFYILRAFYVCDEMGLFNMRLKRSKDIGWNLVILPHINEATDSSVTLRAFATFLF